MSIVKSRTIVEEKVIVKSHIQELNDYRKKVQVLSEGKKSENIKT
ncbi:MAG: hypothetical protein U9O87_01150 [Verrucomicrobiota bacterium]|nr:hypothetical protein [Verrucomicrobiota bacterium]